MKKWVILFFFALLMGACSSQAPTPTATPVPATSEAVVEATEEATAEATEEATAEATEVATTEATEEATAEATEEATEEATIEATVEVAIEATVEATDEVVMEATVEATAEVVSATSVPAFSADTALGDLPVGEWSQIALPEMKCLYDTDYSFFVRPASEPTENLMIYFEGGGACWDGYTCGLRGQFASQFEVLDTEMDGAGQGLLDFTNDANPVKDYNTVFVPYCTGDVHTGNMSDVTFDIPEAAAEAGVTDETVTVNFTGFTNASAVLQWVYDNYVAPSQVFVTGCSAGGYGAINHAANIMNKYEDTRVVMLADASTGVTPKAWEGLATWNTIGNLPDFIPALADVTPEQYSATYHVKQMAKFFPENTFAEYNTFLDQVQVGFYGLQIGRPVDATNFIEIGTEWAKVLLGNIYGMEATLPNFYNYMPGGLVHCITPLPETYTYTVQGVPFVDWVASLLDGTVDKSPMCDPSTTCRVAPETTGG